MAIRLTQDEFISKAKEIHKDYYDYSKVKYINNKTKICIICPEHGEFWQLPSAHLRGQGCPKCGFNKSIVNRTKNTEEFIEKAKKIHGDKYDYSKVEYNGCRIPICIICPIHGEFWQPPYAHLNGQGCPKCGIKRRCDLKKDCKDSFIEKAKQVHGDKYDYSKVEYECSKKNVCIICPEHGEFWQKPANHLSGQGCPICGCIQISRKKRKKLNVFLEEAKKIHGDKYDYSKVEYINDSTKVCIICPVHGEFWQTPNLHLRGCGCKKCRGFIRDYKHLTTEEFIKKSKEIHGDRYDYSKVEYINSSTKVCIVCPVHGEFWQTPKQHLKGCGCRKCANTITAINRRKTLENFVKDAKKIHGDRYDYSKVEYKNSYKRVCIICPTHGEFWQTPHEHLKGCGCPICNSSHLEKEVIDFLNKNNIVFETQKNFEWLGKQRLDFYLSEYNIAIECQGLQHFENISFFGGENAYFYRKKMDEKKRILCEKNNVKIFYYSKLGIDYPYKVYEDFDEMLKKILVTETTVI